MLRNRRNARADRARRGDGKIKPSRIAGIDYGAKRIGIALADDVVRIAGPLVNYERRTPALDAEFFTRLAQAEQIARWVVGLPVHLGGGENESSRAARAFGAWLGELTGLPVDLFDERFTSTEAAQLIAPAHLTKKKRKARLDMIAATVLLDAYLAAGGKGQDDPGGIG